MYNDIKSVDGFSSDKVKSPVIYFVQGMSQLQIADYIFDNLVKKDMNDKMVEKYIAYCINNRVRVKDCKGIKAVSDFLQSA